MEAPGLPDACLVLDRESGPSNRCKNVRPEPRNAGLGSLGREEGDLPQARLLFGQSLAMRRELGDLVGVAGALSELGFAAIEAGDLEAAGALLDESLTVRRGIQDQVGTARMLLHLGTLSRHRGDLPGARRLYQESLALGKGRDRPWIAAFALLGLGLLALQEAGCEPVCSQMEEAIALWQGLADPQGIDRSLHAIARLAAPTQRPSLSPGPDSAAVQAFRLFGAAEALLEASGPSLPTAGRAAWKRTVASVRRSLGRRVSAAWHVGRRKRLEQVLTAVLDEHQIVCAGAGDR